MLNLYRFTGNRRISTRPKETAPLVVMISNLSVAEISISHPAPTKGFCLYMAVNVKLRADD